MSLSTERDPREAEPHVRQPRRGMARTAQGWLCAEHGAQSLGQSPDHGAHSRRCDYDGSKVPASPGVNPSLTITATSECATTQVPAAA